MLEVEARLEVRDVVAQITEILHANAAEVKKYEALFLGHSHLWRNDLTQYFNEWWEDVAIEDVDPDELEDIENQQQVTAWLWLRWHLLSLIAGIATRSSSYLIVYKRRARRRGGGAGSPKETSTRGLC